MPTTPRLSEQERLLRRLEGNEGHHHSHALIVPTGNSGKTSGKSTRSSSIVSGGVPKVKFYLS